MVAEPAFSAVRGTQTVVATDAAGMVSEMKKCRKNAGFTMVELLTVVAILTILMGVAAVSVIKYQRSLKGKEADSAAKEIFIAAQNHLTAADAMGELVSVAADKRGAQVTGKENEYLVDFSSSNAAAATNAKEMWERLLPFGAIDEQVRSGGSYIIHYNLKTATVLDVFYSDASDSRFGATLAAGNYADLSGYAGDSNRDKRRNATVGDQSKRVIGWYGGANAGELGNYEDYLKEPTIKVTNGDTLRVEVSALAAKTGNLKSSASLSLIVTGVNSGAMKEIRLKGSLEGGGNVYLDSNTESIRKEIKSGATLLGYLVTLDDITLTNGNFNNVMMNTDAILNFGGRNGTFIPGEDLDIRAVAFDNGSLSNIAESGTVRVNSLFGSNELELVAQNNSKAKVKVSSIRHLENLENTVSSVDWNTIWDGRIIGTIEVTQTSDLDWTTFNKDYWEKYVRTTNTDLYPYGGRNETLKLYKAGVVPGTEGKFLSLDLGKTKAVQYKGENHQIRNLTIDGGGLFSELSIWGSKVEHLDLVNFKVTTTTGNAGALAGAATAILTNVKVYNDLTEAQEKLLSITGSGNVGGLVGTFTGSAEGCVASAYVNSTGENGSAGGLFGTAQHYSADISLIRHSYSGGHTRDGRYTKKRKKENTENEYEEVPITEGEGRINVQGATAGGLIGTLSGDESVVGCYSTCSVGGTNTVGGLVGSTESDTTISGSYCTGLVALNETPFTKTSGQKIGFFVGENSGTLSTAKGNKNYYMEIVNYIDQSKIPEGSVAITAVGSGSGNATALDGSVDSYNNFVDIYSGNSTHERKTVAAVPYDSSLLSQAKKEGNVPQYGLKRVPYTYQRKKTDGSVEDVNQPHYGDWPIYETLVVNN